MTNTYLANTIRRMTEQAIRSALRLHIEENSYAVSELAMILWELYGGLPVDIITTISNIVEDNKDKGYLGFDSRDYIKLFEDALSAVKGELK